MRLRLLLPLVPIALVGCAGSDRLERPGENLENGDQQWVCQADSGQWDCSDSKPRPIPPVELVAPVPAPEVAPTLETLVEPEAPVNAELPGSDPLSSELEPVEARVAPLPEIAKAQERAEQVLEQDSAEPGSSPSSLNTAQVNEADTAPTTEQEIIEPGIVEPEVIQPEVIEPEKADTDYGAAEASDSAASESAIVYAPEHEHQTAQQSDEGQSSASPTGNIGADDFLALPGDYYTVQVMAVKKRSDLDTTLASINHLAPSVLEISSQGQAWFALFAGVYSSRGEAEVAMADLEAAGQKPWLRKVSGVQRAVRHYREYFQD